jgi:iron complex outermembrane recepter protein
MRTITVVLAMGLALMGAAPAAWAQQQEGQATPAQRARTFDIPAQSLTDGLTLFGRQSGLQISVHGDLVRGLTTPGVSGIMTPEQALVRLLAGSGLVFSISGGTTVTLQKPGAGVAPGAIQLDPVQVQGYPVPQQAMIDNLPPPYAGGQVATGGQLGMLGNRSVMDTPFNQTSYTAKKVQDQQAKTVRDALIDDPSVRATLPQTGIAADNVSIRGLTVGSNATSYGGLYGMLPTYSIMAELAERIEVLKGPSAMLNGMQPFGALGGTINVVPKRAADEPLTQFTANYVSSSQIGGHADIARRFGADKQFGVRFNGVFRSGDSDVLWNSEQRALAALGLDFRGDHVRVAADLGYQYQNINAPTPYLGVANGIPLPWAPNVRSNAGAQPWSYVQRKDLFGTVRAEVDMTESITAYAAFGVHDTRYGDLLGATFLTATNFYGGATTQPQVTNSYNQNLTAEAGVRGQFDTGPIAHEFALSGTTFKQDNGIGAVIGPAYTTSFYNTIVVPRPSLANPAANRTSSQEMSSLAFADTLSAADKRIQLTAGFRLQQVVSANYNAVTGKQTAGYDQSAVTPAVALIFKPWQNVSLYGNFIQGLQPGVVVPTNFRNAGEVFPPFKSTQYEAGVKVDWGRFSTTAGVFQISQPSTITNVATNTLILGGEQRNRGFELNMFGEPVEGVRLLGGLMLLDAVLTKTQGGLTDGWIAPFAPALNLNLAGEWDLPFLRGFTLNSRVIYTGAQYIDTTWPRRSLPDWTRLDVGARYTFDNMTSPTGKPIALRFNVENLLDANYWMGGQASTFLTLGMPRTFRLALTTDF